MQPRHLTAIIKVPVINGQIPPRAVDMGENEDSIPFLIANVVRDKDDSGEYTNPAEMVYGMEGNDRKTLKWKHARYPSGNQVKTSESYRILCYKEDNSVKK